MRVAARWFVLLSSWLIDHTSRRIPWPEFETLETNMRTSLWALKRPRLTCVNNNLQNIEDLANTLLVADERKPFGCANQTGEGQGKRTIDFVPIPDVFWHWDYPATYDGEHSCQQANGVQFQNPRITILINQGLDDPLNPIQHFHFSSILQVEVFNGWMLDHWLIKWLWRLARSLQRQSSRYKSFIIHSSPFQLA